VLLVVSCNEMILSSVRLDRFGDAASRADKLEAFLFTRGSQRIIRHFLALAQHNTASTPSHNCSMLPWGQLCFQ